MVSLTINHEGVNALLRQAVEQGKSVGGVLVTVRPELVEGQAAGSTEE